MMEKLRSTTSAFRYGLRCLAKLCMLLLFLIIGNEAFFYIILKTWPGRGDYIIELQKRSYGYDHFFLGSSRTEVGVNTPVFDSLQSGTRQSFNLGSSAQTLIDQYLTLENLIVSGKEVKECVFELMVPVFNNNYLPLSYTQTLPKVFDLTQQLPVLSQCDFVINLLHKRFHLLVTHYADDLVLEKVNSRQGYLPAKLPFKAYHGTDDRKMDLLPATLTTQQIETVRVMNMVLQRIITRCHDQNIRVLFLLPVQITLNEWPVLGTIWRSLPTELKWETSKHKLWYKLRQPVYWRDYLHTNEAGANLYTAILAATYPKKSITNNLRPEF